MRQNNLESPPVTLQTSETAGRPFSRPPTPHGVEGPGRARPTARTSFEQPPQPLILGMDQVGNAPPGSGSQILMVILPRGSRHRMRPEHGSIWFALGGGLVCETPILKTRCTHGEACTTESAQDLTCSVSERPDSMAIGIAPHRRSIEFAFERSGGSQAKHAVLLPQSAWALPAYFESACREALRARQESQLQLAMGFWAEQVLVHCVAQQATLRSLVPLCSGRNYRQKQSMLCRLLRARMVMQQLENPTVTHGAQAALLSNSRFISAHRNVFGETPARSLHRFRLERAHDQLMAGNLAVMDVAETVGYRNRSSFSRAFKSRFGYSPSHSAEMIP